MQGSRSLTKLQGPGVNLLGPDLIEEASSKRIEYLIQYVQRGVCLDPTSALQFLPLLHLPAKKKPLSGDTATPTIFPTLKASQHERIVFRKSCTGEDSTLDCQQVKLRPKNPDIVQPLFRPKRSCATSSHSEYEMVDVSLLPV